MMGTVLTSGVHFGTIPNCGNKPSLFLPGAETLSSAFNFAPRYKKVTTREGQHLTVETTCELYLPDGTFVGEGTSMCSTYESKYRYRGGSRLCPACGKDAIINGKEEYGGGYICYAKKGGCGAKFRKGDKSIEGQSLTRVENEDLADQWNTVVKMGAKRAFVHAVRTATGTADVFTQDLEDFRDSYGIVIDAEVLPAISDRKEEQPTGMNSDDKLRRDEPGPEPPAVNGWTLEYQGQYTSLVQTVMFKLFKGTSIEEKYQEEADKWDKRRKSDPPEKVIPALEKRIASLKAAMEKASAPTTSEPKPDPVPPSQPSTESAIPGFQRESDYVQEEGTPSYADAAKTAFQSAALRFENQYRAQGLTDPQGLTKQMIAHVKAKVVFGKLPDETQDERRMMLAQALGSEANKLKIP
jgi:hypothetical protein